MNLTVHKQPADPEPQKSVAEDQGESRISLLQAISDWLKHALGQKQDHSLKEALEEVIEEHEEQDDERLSPEEKLMLHNVLSFSDIKVSDIMIPRTDIAAVSHDIPLQKLIAHITEYRHTRIPVYQGTLDHLLGFIHVKDLLPIAGSGGAFDIKALIRELVFVPPSMRILDLMAKMRKSGHHMAVVVDEYGGTDGLITLEDLFEEIVGDIQDEHDEDEEQDDKVLRVSDKLFEVSARIPIEKLEKELGLNLVTEEKADEFDTLGGLIFFQLGRVPTKGEIIPHVSGARFEVISADPRRIHKVRIITFN